MNRKLIAIIAVCVGICAGCLFINAQQRNDPDFDTKIARPAHTNKQLRVLIDGAHKNAFSVMTNRVDPLVALMRADGLVVDTGKDAFSASVLAPYDLLVILTARGKDANTDPAFTTDELDSVHNWVNKGGSMLFCVDHTPFAAAGKQLAARFGVDVLFGTVSDPGTADLWFGPSDFRTPVYSRANRGLIDHPISRGRNQGERADKIGVFGGESLIGPKKSWNLLTVTKTAVNSDAGKALGTSQAVALQSGDGRVVITSDCSMWTAQFVTVEKKEHRYGMNRTDLGNRQFAINVVRWLTRALN